MAATGVQSAPWCFLRHAEAPHNLAGQLTGPPDAPLTPQGRAAALRCGRALASRARGLARLLVSPHRRCRETASLVLEGADLELPIAVLDGLRERELGDPARLLPAQRLDWDAAPEGGESNRELALRVLADLAGADAAPALVVSHAGPLRVVLGLLQGRSTAELGRLRIPLCSPLWQEVPPGRLRQLHDWCTREASPETP